MRLALLAVGVAVATSPSARAGSPVENCENWQKMASLIMEARQSGVTQVEQIRRVNSTPNEIDPGGAMRMVMLDFVDLAYSTPLAETPRGAEIAAISFGEKIFVDCMR